ncbi:MAG TPA: 3D domain-containing protein [Acidobacteriota bacterium]|jgi:3D (Asp-Asp-Asp) domain-containing protein
MHSNEKDGVWIFASTLFAIFLLFFSGLAIHYTDPREPVTEVQPAGDEPLAVNGQLPVNRRLFDREFLATAYSDFGITKSGVVAATGIIAADPNVLPIGSIIEIDAGSYSGIYTVMDTGSAVKGERIDIFIPDYDEAMQFGSRKVAVKILRRGWNPQGGLTNAG